MRAVGYFTFDPDASKGPRAYQTRYLAFRNFCEGGLHIDTRIFADPEGQAGFKGWDEMLEFIRSNGLAYLVVVPNAQTLGETLDEQVARVLEIDALGSRAVCADPNYPDPLQNALRGARAAGGRRERIRQGMMAKAAKGLGLGKPPYGYRILGDGSFQIVPEEAETVCLIYNEYLESGGGIRAVAAVLNERGLRTRNGKQWSIATVRDILRNAAYIGTYRRFGLRISGSYEPIVTPDVFRRAQKRLSERGPSRPRPHRASFLLSGLLFCGHCGGRMMGVTRRQSWTRKDGRRGRGEYRYYQCQTRINRNECDYHTIRAAPLEEEVAAIARRELRLRQEDGPCDADSWLDRDRAHSTARIRALDKRFMAGVQRAASGKLTLSQLRAGAERLRVARDALALRIEQTSEAGSAQTLFNSNADRFIGEWESLPYDERRDLLRLLVTRVTVKDNCTDVDIA